MADGQSSIAKQLTSPQYYFRLASNVISAGTGLLPSVTERVVRESSKIVSLLTSLAAIINYLTV